MKETSIYGLLLAGGESRRMGREKATLRYDGQRTQLQRTTELLRNVCPRVFVSQRESQALPVPKDAEVIHDRIAGVSGPLCGILSAMATHPRVHWLVVACDLPFLQKETLLKLLHAFDATSPQLTAYRSSYDGLPEPLCAVYPSGSDRELLDLSRQLDNSCPRKLLIVKKARLLPQEDPHSLDNINTAEEYAAITEPRSDARPST